MGSPRVGHGCSNLAHRRRQGEGGRGGFGNMFLSESYSWLEAGLLHPALLSSPKSVQAPAVGPGFCRQDCRRARVRPEGG